MGEYAKRGFDQVNENKKANGPGGEKLWVESVKNRINI